MTLSDEGDAALRSPPSLTHRRADGALALIGQPDGGENYIRRLPVHCTV